MHLTDEARSQAWLASRSSRPGQREEQAPSSLVKVSSEQGGPHTSSSSVPQYLTGSQSIAALPTESQTRKEDVATSSWGDDTHMVWGLGRSDSWELSCYCAAPLPPGIVETASTKAFGDGRSSLISSS